MRISLLHFWRGLGTPVTPVLHIRLKYRPVAAGERACWTPRGDWALCCCVSASRNAAAGACGWLAARTLIRISADDGQTSTEPTDWKRRYEPPLTSGTTPRGRRAVPRFISVFSFVFTIQVSPVAFYWSISQHRRKCIAASFRYFETRVYVFSRCTKSLRISGPFTGIISSHIPHTWRK